MIATNIKQSKELAKVLPLESADMMWFISDGLGEPILMVGYNPTTSEDIPAWSLTALLEILDGVVLCKSDTYNAIIYYNDGEGEKLKQLICKADSYIDACYEMIVKLKQLKAL